MFAAQKLNDVLQNHPIFEHVKSAIPISHLKSDETEQLLHIQGGNLYVWNENNSSLLTSNLRGVLDGDVEAANIQSLICQDAPVYPVKKILLDSTSSNVALIGARYVTVLVLPQRWGRQAEYEGGKSKIICKSIPIAERFFISNISVQLIQASWYPVATSSVPHLCLLTSDNMLRIYNVRSDPQVPVQSHKLMPSDSSNLSLTGSRMSLLSMYSVTSGLGETVIAFDFAPPVEYAPKAASKLKSKTPQAVQLQPIYLLQGNGDVLLLLTSLNNSKFSKGILQGPLIMLPMAEDNYGVDSCSIFVMPGAPTTVVIATSSGKLHHCIALWPSSDDDDDDDLTDIDSQSIHSRLSSIKRDPTMSEELKPPTLYVYETVELEMNLSAEENDFENHFVNLFGDPVLSCRYHCCTAVGVHTVALPWLVKMNAFVQADERSKDILSDLMHDEPCVVEHVLCTKPTPSSPPCLIKGFTVVSDPMLGPALLCLLADGHCVTLPLLSTFSSQPPPLLSKQVDTSLATSPLKRVAESNFENHVRSLLSRELSQPIIRAGDWDSASSDRECLQLVTRATQVLRDEYILKQKLARDAISKRVQLLDELKAQQHEDLRDLEGFREELTSTCQRIASDYEECQERQENLILRLEKVTKMVKDRDPVLSQAEVNMSKELKTIVDKLQHLDNRIKQLKIKEEYQAKQYRKQDNAGTQRGDRDAGLPSASVRTERFKQILLEEGDKISELIKKLNNMNMQVGL